MMLLSTVAAGTPAAVNNELEHIDLNYFLTRGNQSSVLVRVDGESMAREIADGDWVMIDREQCPKPNDIVLAYLNGGYTIKRHKLNDRDGRRGLYLVPANDLYETKTVTEHDDFEIFGVVTWILHPVARS